MAQSNESDSVVSSTTISLPWTPNGHKEKTFVYPAEDLLPPCKVCGDKASGFHFGAVSCEACKVRKMNTVVLCSRTCL